MAVLRRAKVVAALYDYACHAVDLIHFLHQVPQAVSGVVRQPVFSRDVDDEVYSTLHFPDGSSGQLSVNWSDESFRKMATKVSIWGMNGRLVWIDRSAKHTCDPPHLNCLTTERVGPYDIRQILRRRFGFIYEAKNTQPKSITSFAILTLNVAMVKTVFVPLWMQIAWSQCFSIATKPTKIAERQSELTILNPRKGLGHDGCLAKHLLHRAACHGSHTIGDNQFFGVNHMSEEKARSQSIRFQDLSAIIDVLDIAYTLGIRTFMCTTHDRVW